MVKKRRLFDIPDYGDVDDPLVRAKYGYLEATVSIIGNILIFFLKLVLGVFINSIALVADAVHSLSDVSTSGVVIFGFRIAKKEPDPEHPYGHGRVEYIATLIIAIILVLVGLGFIQQSIERILDMENLRHQEYAVVISGIVLVSAVGKELMARYSNMISQKIQSDVLKADAWHHRSDALSSIGVAIGILGARYGFPILDPIFGIMVSIIIIYVGINLVRSASDFLIGQAPNRELIQKIKEIANTTENVIGVHDLSIHDYGTTKILTLHAEVDRNLPLEKAHDIADKLEVNIQKEVKYSLVIHLDPVKISKDTIRKRKIIETILTNHKDIKSFHKLRIIQSDEKDRVMMHLVVNKDMPIHDSHQLCHSLKTLLEKEYGPCEIDIHFEPCDNHCKVCKITCSQRKKKK